MAGKTTAMSKVKQVLLWKQQGRSNREIARLVGINKETVNTYVNKAKADPMPLEKLVDMDDYALDVRFRGGSPAYCDHRFEVFKRLLPYLQEQMSDPKKHVTLQLLWEEYCRDNPLDHYSLTQFRYHYNQNTVAQTKVSTILSDLHNPGEKIYIDFSGDTLSYINIETGEIVKVQTFVACLPFSGYTFAMAVPSQRTEDFVYALTRCFRFLGGVPKILVPDNLKAAVVKSDRHEPELNRMLDEMANHYGSVVLPARVRHPQDKSAVEGMVKILYNRVYAPLRNRQFYSLAELNNAISELVVKHNQTRMQLHPYTREEQFLSVEKPTLRQLPDTDYEIRNHAIFKVHTDGCFLLGSDKHYYTVPYQYVGRQVQVEYTRTLVKAYVEGRCIATHERDYRQGRYSIIKEHLHEDGQYWRGRSKEYYICKAMCHMDELASLITCMFANKNQPDIVYFRTCDNLFHLMENTDPTLFRKACGMAVEMKQYTYSFVRNIIRSQGAGLKEESVSAPNPTHENIRGAQAFK